MDDELEVSTGRGTARMISRAPGVMFTVFSGHVDDGIYDAVRKFAEAELAAHGPPMRLYFDTTGMTGFTTSFRKKMLVWQAATLKTMPQMALVKSPLVSLAIAAANRIAGGGVEITSNRARFERALKDAIASAHTSISLH